MPNPQDNEDLLLALNDPMESQMLDSSGADADVSVPSPVTSDPQFAGIAPPTAAGGGESDVLKNYFSRQMQMKNDLSQAENRADQNRFYAQLGGAFNTIGSGLAGRKADNAPYQQMAVEADKPIERTLRQQKLASEGDKVVSNYLLRKGVAQQQATEKEKDRVFRGGIEEKKIGAVQDRTKAMTGIAGQRLDLAKKGFDLRNSKHATGIAGAFMKDKIMMQTSAQDAQIDKGLDTIQKVTDKKLPFSTTVISDLEKDIANILSGGTSSSLGQVKRVEFRPVVTEFQSLVDKIQGYQGDVNSPEYMNQLKNFLTELKQSVGGIQQRRAAKIGASYAAANEGNDLATKTIESNMDLSKVPAGAKVPTKKQFNKDLNKTRITYSDGTVEELDGRK